MTTPSIYERKKRWKIWLFIIAIAIGIFTLLYTNFMVKQLSTEERNKMLQWADANRLITSSEDLNSETYNYLLKVIRGNKTIPVILVDEKGHINSANNFDSIKEKDEKFLQRELLDMQSKNDSIKFYFDPSDSTRYNVLYYKESVILQQLRYYPFVQLGVISLFLLVSYLAFSASRRSEQNKVWLGMSKETAHQLGTPISSLMAWVEILKSEVGYKEGSVIDDMDKDLQRLNLVTERFSKIGSEPILANANICDVISTALDYMEKRSSKKVTFIYNKNNAAQSKCLLNVPLFEWVIENLVKNAIDAMDGEGTITCSLQDSGKHVMIDFLDTGKGMKANQYKTIFNPGFTTKKRGWGMGLSLVKRIIESYHRGRIYVRHSEQNKGTTIRIELRKTNT
jgi:signal transduction histidine kinase